MKLLGPQVAEAWVPKQILLLYPAHEERGVRVVAILLDMFRRAPCMSPLAGHECSRSEDHLASRSHNMEVQKPIVTHAEANGACFKEILHAVALSL